MQPLPGFSEPEDSGEPGTAAPLIPEKPSLPVLQEAAAGCRACHLWELGTQMVFGEGQPRAKAMLIGEQPGDVEDVAGRPFVGPAGTLLDTALERAEIDRSKVYVTNVVKHFKWEARGKRRIHSTPDSEEISACRPWLDAEIEVIRPEVIVCLGATAAQALLGRQFRVTRQRGEFIASPLAQTVMATVHPWSILRAPDDEARRVQLESLVLDLKRVAPLLR